MELIYLSDHMCARRTLDSERIRKNEFRMKSVYSSKLKNKHAIC